MLGTTRGKCETSKRWKAALAVGVTASVVLAACGSDEKSTSTVGGGDHRRRGDHGRGGHHGRRGDDGQAGDDRRGGDDRPRQRPPPRPAARRRRAASRSIPGSKSPPPAGVGLIDGVYKGTAGFELDPKSCPSDWDPKQGITDTEINLFNSLPTSGPLAGFGLLADGAKAYFKYINDNGGIDGPQDRPRHQGRRLQARPDQDQRRRGARLEQVRLAVRHARHAEQPGGVGRDQRRVHAPAAQRHRCRPVG